MPHFLDSLNIEGDGKINSLVLPSQVQAISLNGTLNLLTSAPTSIVLTGSGAGYSVVLPNCTAEPQGHLHNIYNTTNETILIKDNTGALLTTLSQQGVCYAYLQTSGTQAGVWLIWQVLLSSVASGVINYNITSSVPFTSTNRVDPYQLITGFQVTPQAGTYACWYNASVYYTTTPKAHFWAFHKAGTILQVSQRQQDTAHSNQTMVDSTMVIESFTGSETCDIRVKCDNTGALTVNQRSMLLIRIGT